MTRSLKVEAIGFLTSKVKIDFTRLRHVFTKASLLRHFDLECHLQIKTNMSGYVIGGVLTQLTLDDFGQWHLVDFFSKKMILSKIGYKTHYNELLAIVEVFQTWHYYLKDYKIKSLFLSTIIIFVDLWIQKV